MLTSRIAEGQAEEERIQAILTTQDAVADVAGTIPAGGTGAAAGGWDTAGNRNTAITTMSELITQFNALLAELRAAKIIAT